MADSVRQYLQDSHPHVIPKCLLTDDIDKAVVPFSVGDVVDITQDGIDPSGKKRGPPKETVVSLKDAAVKVNRGSDGVNDQGALLVVSVTNPRERCN